MNRILRILFIYAFLSAACSGVTRYAAPPGVGVNPVPGFTSWDTAATSIFEAVGVCAPGDLLLVSNGTYYLTNQINITNLVIQSDNNGALDRDGTVLNGNFPAYSNRCFYINHASAVVEGFTITNCYVTTNGGAVYIAASGGTLRNCLVTGNTATNCSGGGVYATGANSLITNCDLIGNFCKYSASSDNGGGGVKLASAARLWNSRIMFNDCGRYYSAGGGIHAEGAAWVVNCSIVSNTLGAGYKIGTANTHGYGGGGIWARGPNAVTLRNCLILGNAPGAYTDKGAGLGSWGASADIQNCTIMRNYGTGIGAGAASTYRVVNTVSYYNNGLAMYPAAGGTLNATNCCATTTNYVTSGLGNFTNCPMFMQYAGGDYRLTSWSPGVDTGLVLPWMSDASDLAGQPRLSLNGLVDIGAYETSAGGPAYTYYVAQNSPTPISPYTGGWDSAAARLEDAVNVVSDGSTILVSNGVYDLSNEVVVFNFKLRSFNSGAADPDGTIINGNNYVGKPVTNRCFTVGHVSAMVEGFTITNGLVASATRTTTNGGGGVYMSAGTLKNCLVTGNTTTNENGGGVYATGSGSLITNCRVIANETWFPDGAAPGNGGGGGLRMASGAQVWNSLVMFNKAPLYCGGGGGVHCAVTVMVANCSIISNTASDGWFGGGVCLVGQSNTLRNCLIAGHDDGRQNYSAGVGALEGLVNFIENCTIVNNYGHGIGARTSGGTTYQVANTISFNNTGVAMYPGPTGKLIASNCCATATNYITAGSTANTTNNPSFQDYSAGNYRLKADSPCVNTGANRGWMADTTDLDGKPRIFYNTPDMGAYELIYAGTVYGLR
ncbi:MAG: right-handed parallel beta-helix repeat-containing protein [Kiritimatiellia bacterium]